MKDESEVRGIKRPIQKYKTSITIMPQSQQSQEQCFNADFDGKELY